MTSLNDSFPWFPRFCLCTPLCYKGSSFPQPLLALTLQSPATPQNTGLNKAQARAALWIAVHVYLHGRVVIVGTNL